MSRAASPTDPVAFGFDFDFDAPLDRRGTNSLKWEDGIGAHELPMWVADMDFATAPAVARAVQQRAAHPAFGYSIVPAEYERSICTWWDARHGLDLPQEQVIFTTGVVPAISSIVRSLTNVAENVLVQPPVYNIFYNSILNNGRKVLPNPLRYRDGRYAMDFDDLEAKMADPQTSLMILCNPHNPTGNVWTRDDLVRVGELAQRHGVVVVSDEIHCEITRPGMQHVPFAAASPACRQVSVTCASPSKAFNLAGLQSAYVFAADPFVRHRVWRGLNTDEVAEPNAFACASTIAAYSPEGARWLDQLRVYIQANKDLVQQTLESRPDLGVRMTASDATYLCWLDCSAITDDAQALCDVVRRATGLVVSAGSIYGEGGRCFVRMNVGTTRARVEDGLRRWIAGVEAWQASAR